MPLAIFAEGLNASLGGRIGDETAAFYAWVVERGAASLAFDGGSALDMLAITPTLFSEWARRQDWAALAAIAEDHEERAPRSLPDASMLHHAHAAPSAGGWR